MQIQWVFYSSRLLERFGSYIESPVPFQHHPHTSLLSAVLQTCQNWCERRHSISEQSVHDKAPLRTLSSPLIHTPSYHLYASHRRPGLVSMSLPRDHLRTESNKPNIYVMIGVLLIITVFVNAMSKSACIRRLVERGNTHTHPTQIPCVYNFPLNQCLKKNPSRLTAK